MCGRFLMSCCVGSGGGNKRARYSEPVREERADREFVRYTRRRKSKWRNSVVETIE